MGGDIQPSKKRAAGREISKDNPGLDDDAAPEMETGTFQKASDEVLANRRIVKVRRQQTSAPSSNPFAGIRLVPPPVASGAAPAEATTAAPAEATTAAQAGEDEESGEEVDKKEETKTEETSAENQKSSVLNENESKNKVDNTPAESAVDQENADAAGKAIDAHPADDKEANGGAEEATRLNGDGEKGSVDHAKEKADEKAVDPEDGEGENIGSSEKNGDEKPSAGAAASFSSFQQLSSTPNAFSGLSGSGFGGSSFSFGSIPKDGSSSGALSTFSFGSSNNGSELFLGTIAGNAGTKTEGSGFPSKQDVQVETGEENEVSVFTADSVLFEFLDGGWRERGKGEVKVNATKEGAPKARLVMRTRGNFRLILNASIYPDMKLTSMEKRGITFACINSATEGKEGLATFALKFKDTAHVESFSTVVEAQKKVVVPSNVNAPENSPKASDV